MLESKLEFLRTLPIFAELTQAQLVDVARYCDAFNFKRNSIIAYQRDIADRMYIVRTGFLDSFHVDNDGVVTNSRRYGPGDYFEDIWLLEPAVHNTTVRAASDGLLYVLREDEFLHFLEDNPNATLDMSEEAWDELDRSQAVLPVKRQYSSLSLLPGELIEYESRRSAFLLAYLLLLPLLVTIMVPFGVIALGTQIMSFPMSLPLLCSAGLFGMVPFLFAIYRLWDWSNDYLLITNKHLVHTEFSLSTFRGQIIKIPLDQVQSLTVAKPTFLQTFLGVGNVRISTAAQREGLEFDFIQNPGEVQQVYDEIRNRERLLNESRTRTLARRSLETHFEVPDQIIHHEEDQDAQAVANRRATSTRRKRPRRGREEVDGVITYGRHWIVLLQRAWWLMLLTLVSVIGLPIAYFMLPVLQFPLVAGLFVMIVLVEAFGLFYYFEDWNNDLFQVTQDLVIDIDRGPFGFTESRKTAQLINVQNVSADRPNFWATLFGYGRVVIDTAGSSADIVFENVTNPNQIQADIFERRENVLRRRRRTEASSRQQEFAIVLDEYQQLREQEKIKARTPGLEEEAELPANRRRRY